MAVVANPARIAYSGDGSTATFSFPYYIFGVQYLSVFLYDTLAGGVTIQSYGTKWTFSGTANAQGLYPNGLSVIFGTAPPSTSVVVLLNTSTPNSNYLLGQNQGISSASLTQSLDYIAIVLQYLQDQLYRCIRAPDGIGIVAGVENTFPGELPSNLAFLPGMSPMVNATGNGWIMGNAQAWAKLSIPYSSFTAGATTQAITAFVLPPGYMLQSVCVKHTTAFAGTSLTALALSLGVSGDQGKFINAFNAFQSVGDTAFDYEMPFFIGSWANNTTIQLYASATGANLSALNAGAVDVWYQIAYLGTP